MNIAINGFGRIGRAVFRIALSRGINVVAINDIHGISDAAYLLKYDSVYGPYPETVTHDKQNLIVNGKKIRVFQEKDPTKLPWKQLNVPIVIESTGVFRDKEGASQHLQAGAQKVIVSAPGTGLDVTFVPGVNDKALTKNMQLVSVASCTTNCLAPVAQVLHDNFKIENALMTTIHAYTADQALVDGNHKKPRRGRAAAQNIIPTTTGASKAVSEAIPALTGKLNGIAIRVPVITGSLTDLTAQVKKKTNAKKVNAAFKTAAHRQLQGILQYTEDEIVSSDIIGNPHSAIVDGLSTMVEGDFVKILAWYDNEYGYSNRMVDVIETLKKWVK